MSLEAPDRRRADARNWQHGDTMSFAVRLISAWPRQTAVILAAFLLAGLMEGIGVTTVLPLLTILMPRDSDPGTVGGLVDRAFALTGLTPGIGPILGLIVVMLTAKAAVSYFAAERIGYITSQIAKELRLRLIRALLRAKWQHFGSLAVGRSANAIGTEAQRAANSYQNLCRAMADFMQVAVYVVLALFISWKITAGAVAAGLVIVYALKKLIVVARRAGQEQTRLFSSILARVTDTMSGVKALKAMGRESFFEKILVSEVSELADAQKREHLATQTLLISREPAVALILAAGLYVAVTFMGAPLSTLFVLAFMFFRVVSKLTILQSSYQRVAVLESAYWSLLLAIEQAESLEEQDTGGGRDVPALARHIRLDRISFSHAPGGKGGGAPVLYDVCATFPARSFNAVIGPSGAGKTTLMDILAGLYAPDQGRVLIDDVSLDSVNLTQWRRALGYLPQECLLFHDTIFQNISLGDPGITREQVQIALRQAGAWDFIAALPEGLDTVAGERGSRFSGGQRQRIAIARALVTGPKLLLLDEPTSAMDEETERQFLETVKALSRAVTVVAITHNPAVVKYADHVFRIESGHVEERAAC